MCLPWLNWLAALDLIAAGVADAEASRRNHLSHTRLSQLHAPGSAKRSNELGLPALGWP